jgi:hypothetical protein
MLQRIDHLEKAIRQLMFDEPRSRKSLSDHRLSAFSHKGETLINLTTGNSDGFKLKKTKKSINKSWAENALKTFDSEGYKS